VEEKKCSFELGTFTYGISNTIIILVLSLAIWFLWGLDIETLFPGMFGAYLFWAVLCIVFLGFCGESWPFTKLPQPQAGILALLVTLILDVIIVNALSGYGSVIPTFSTAPGGTGWTAIAMIVLFGFYGYGVQSNNMDHWPWKDIGLKQPYVGIIEIFVGTFITGVLYFLLLYPTLAAYASKIQPLLPLPTVVGWFYAVVVFWLTSALLWENWPWTMFSSRAAKAMASLFGNFLGGTVVFYFFMYLLQNFLIPADAQKALGDGITLWPAQLGVCIAGVELAMLLCFQSWPTTGSLSTRLIIRTIIAFAVGILVFYIYTRWFGFVLKEAPVTKDFGGNPLMFMDLFNCVLLIYTVYFASWPLKSQK